MIAFAIPMMIGGIFQLMYNMVDTVVLGRYVGVNALAAIGATGTTVFGIVQVGCAVMNAISVVAAQSFGSGDNERLRMAVGNSVWLVLISGGILGAVGLWGARPLMELLRTPEDIIDGAVRADNMRAGHSAAAVQRRGRTAARHRRFAHAADIPDILFIAKCGTRFTAGAAL